MMNKNQNFKFKKKSPKSTKLSEIKKDKISNDYSKIICEVLDKNKEESKNNITNSNNNSKIKHNRSLINNSQRSNIHPKNIVKIELNYNKKSNKNNLKEEVFISSIKEKKIYNSHGNNPFKNKNTFQSNSEKNITKEKIKEEGMNKNKINNSSTNVALLNKNKKININLNSINENFIFRKNKSYHNKKEENKSTEKKNGEKIKNIEEIKEKTINIQYNIKEIFSNKKGNENLKQFYLSNGNTNEMKKK